MLEAFSALQSMQYTKCSDNLFRKVSFQKFIEGNALFSSSELGDITSYPDTHTHTHRHTSPRSASLTNCSKTPLVSCLAISSQCIDSSFYATQQWPGCRGMTPLCYETYTVACSLPSA